MNKNHKGKILYNKRPSSRGINIHAGSNTAIHLDDLEEQKSSSAEGL